MSVEVRFVPRIWNIRQHSQTSLELIERAFNAQHGPVGRGGKCTLIVLFECDIDLDLQAKIDALLFGIDGISIIKSATSINSARKV